jgi:hypothetical protein
MWAWVALCWGWHCVPPYVKLVAVVTLVLVILGYRTFDFQYSNDGWRIEFWKPAPPPRVPPKWQIEVKPEQ